MVDELDNNVGKKILNIFLDLPNCQIIAIIKLKPYTEKNSTYVQALWTEVTFKDRRWTKNVESSTLIYALAPLIT